MASFLQILFYDSEAVFSSKDIDALLHGASLWNLRVPPEKSNVTTKNQFFGDTISWLSAPCRLIVLERRPVCGWEDAEIPSNRFFLTDLFGFRLRVSDAKDRQRKGQ